MAEMKTFHGYEIVDAKAREEIIKLQNTEVDLTNYATKDFVTGKIAEAQLSGGDSGDIDLSGYALKSDIPTKVSELANDKNYLTEHQSLEGYATETYVNDAIANIDIPDTSKFITTIPAEYVTDTELNNKGYLTEVPSEYITETELNAKGYATEKYVDDAVANIEIPELDTTNFLKKATDSNQYLWYVTTSNSNTHQQLSYPVERMDIDFNHEVAGTTLNNNTIVMRTGLDIRVPETPAAGCAASKEYVDNAVSKASGNIDLSGYYTKEEVNALFNGIATAEGGSY